MDVNTELLIANAIVQALIMIAIIIQSYYTRKLFKEQAELKYPDYEIIARSFDNTDLSTSGTSGQHFGCIHYKGKDLDLKYFEFEFKIINIRDIPLIIRDIQINTEETTKHLFVDNCKSMYYVLNDNFDRGESLGLLKELMISGFDYRDTYYPMVIDKGSIRKYSILIIADARIDEYNSDIKFFVKIFAGKLEDNNRLTKTMIFEQPKFNTIPMIQI